MLLKVKGAKGVTLPDTVTTIEEYAFHWDENLEYVNLSNNLEFIGMDAFSGCDRLTAINLPASVKTIQSSAFSDTAITSAHITTGFESWARAFDGCTKLTDVTIDEGVKEIPNYAFYNCSSLSEIKLPNSLETLGRFAFSETVLEKIEIPATMTSLGGAFINCRKLTDINIPETTSEPETDAPTVEPTTQPVTDKPTQPVTDKPTEPETVEPTQPVTD